MRAPSLPPRMTPEPWMGAAGPIITAVSDESFCFGTPTWGPGITAEWINPGGLTAVNFRYYVNGELQKSGALGAGAVTTTQSSDKALTSAECLQRIEISFTDAKGASPWSYRELVTPSPCVL